MKTFESSAMQARAPAVQDFFMRIEREQSRQAQIRESVATLLAVKIWMKV